MPAVTRRQKEKENKVETKEAETSETSDSEFVVVEEREEEAQIPPGDPVVDNTNMQDLEQNEGNNGAPDVVPEEEAPPIEATEPIVQEEAPVQESAQQDEQEQAEEQQPEEKSEAREPIFAPEPAAEKTEEGEEPSQPKEGELLDLKTIQDLEESIRMLDMCRDPLRAAVVLAALQAKGEVESGADAALGWVFDTIEKDPKALETVPDGVRLPEEIANKLAEEIGTGDLRKLTVKFGGAKTIDFTFDGGSSKALEDVKAAIRSSLNIEEEEPTRYKSDFLLIGPKKRVLVLTAAALLHYSVPIDDKKEGKSKKKQIILGVTTKAMDFFENPSTKAKRLHLPPVHFVAAIAVALLLLLQFPFFQSVLGKVSRFATQSVLTQIVLPLRVMQGGYFSWPLRVGGLFAWTAIMFRFLPSGCIVCNWMEWKACVRPIRAARRSKAVLAVVDGEKEVKQFSRHIMFQETTKEKVVRKVHISCLDRYFQKRVCSAQLEYFSDIEPDLLCNSIRAVFALSQSSRRNPTFLVSLHKNKQLVMSKSLLLDDSAATAGLWWIHQPGTAVSPPTLDRFCLERCGVAWKSVLIFLLIWSFSLVIAGWQDAAVDAVRTWGDFVFFTNRVWSTPQLFLLGLGQMAFTMVVCSPFLCYFKRYLFPVVAPKAVPYLSWPVLLAPPIIALLNFSQSLHTWSVLKAAGARTAALASASASSLGWLLLLWIPSAWLLRTHVRTTLCSSTFVWRAFWAALCVMGILVEVLGPSKLILGVLS